MVINNIAGVESVDTDPASFECSGGGLPPVSERPQQARMRGARGARGESHLSAGPVTLSLSFGMTTLALQVLLTDKAQLGHDAAQLCANVPGHESLLGGGPAQLLCLYSFIYAFIVGSSFFLMPNIFPAAQSEPDLEGGRTPMEVPYRRRNMPQHKLVDIDWSYVALNTLCMPGFFYHCFCLLRSWGLDPAAPPYFGMFPPLDTEHLAAYTAQLFLETLPEALGSLAVYMLTYEFLYYWWHRSMHEVPALYKWVHRHHHQQTYPDRAALDTFNTGCVESQVGLYMQLAVLWACGELGVVSVPGGLWFVTIAGWLSVLEHDKFDRNLLNFWRADEHHMHHAFVKCNYSPYSSIWDKAFGTHKPFEVKKAAPSATPRSS